MRWRTKSFRYGNWHRWFAWYPVVIGNEFVWLEFVERKLVLLGDGLGRVYPYPIWDYRFGYSRFDRPPEPVSTRD